MAVDDRQELIWRLHREYGHLGWPGLRGIMKTRAWWPTIRADVDEAVRTCPNCQVSQGSKETLQRESARYLSQAGVRPFERWGVDLIGRLPETPNGNRWIITAIDYATGWPHAKAVPEATEEAVTDFLHDTIFVNHGAPREFITDNGANLLAESVRYYVR